MKNKDWHEYAIRTIEQIREFRQISALGNYISPAEYINSLEEYVKLFYGINEVPGVIVKDFFSIKKSFEEFKVKINYLCDALLEKVRDDNDTPKDKEASKSA